MAVFQLNALLFAPKNFEPNTTNSLMLGQQSEQD